MRACVRVHGCTIRARVCVLMHTLASAMLWSGAAKLAVMCALAAFHMGCLLLMQINFIWFWLPTIIAAAAAEYTAEHTATYSAGYACGGGGGAAHPNAGGSIACTNAGSSCFRNDGEAEQLACGSTATAFVVATLVGAFALASARGLYGGAGFWPLSNFQLYSTTLGHHTTLTHYVLQFVRKSGAVLPFGLNVCSSSYAVRSVGLVFPLMRDYVPRHSAGAGGGGDGTGGGAGGGDDASAQCGLEGYTQWIATMLRVEGFATTSPSSIGTASDRSFSRSERNDPIVRGVVVKLLAEFEGGAVQISSDQEYEFTL